MIEASKILELNAVDQRRLHLLAELLALKLADGDVIALHGDLGAGKTTFARALIRALAADPDYEVPSPTYAIAQIYDDTRLPVTHFDWYRLSDAAELEEIGFPWRTFSEGIGVALVEWPDRAVEYLPGAYLKLELSEATATPDVRRVVLSIAGPDAGLSEAMKARLTRFAGLLGFLETYADKRSVPLSAIHHVNGDASARSYARLVFENETSELLMDSPAMPDGPPLPGGQPYSRIAHLAENITPFLVISEALASTGLSVPRIEAADSQNGFAVIEDLGDAVFDRIPSGALDVRSERTTAALDALLHLRAAGQARTQLEATVSGRVLSHALRHFDRAALHAEIDLLLQWAWPQANAAALHPDTVARFHAAWDETLGPVSQARDGWVLRDYHSPNLIWCPERDGVRRVGIIDYQDAMRGHWAYDVASLIQDARVDMPTELQARLLDHYCREAEAQFNDFSTTEFKQAFAILGAQRATKIIGIFHRLAARDGKPRYLAHLPRVAGYLAQNLHHPALAPVEAWFAENMPGIASTAPPTAQ